ncbi:hypothetical protein BCY91_14050 [Pelobium manganitolerans]|uniref:Holliday junction resolvase RuvC n=1 Tax=Pelobium manganitolerans TaxID=1842495 RepID=A0A419S9Y5_9SPHI|nr:hypothetical protein [Pelobium manganitolerans]RKD18995.1 hypothetical protein BCY91_14050 [Pelobium manganitolerans]
MDKNLIIGIDPGVKTGIAVYSKKEKKLLELHTVRIHRAFEIVTDMGAHIEMVRIEDARQRKWLGSGDAEAKKQGAGSVKRDCKIWEDFLQDKAIPFQMTSPGKVKTKISTGYFKALTGWQGVTSNHARDAAMLVWGF